LCLHAPWLSAELKIDVKGPCLVLQIGRMKNDLILEQRLSLYENSDYEIGRQERVAGLLRTVIKPGTRILEIGAGLGHFTRMLLDLGCTVEIVEADPERVGFLRKSFAANPKVRIHEGLFPACLAQAGLKDSKFDGALLLEVIEHVPDPKGFLAELARVLSPQAPLVISTPNRLSMESIVHLVKFLFAGRVFNAGDTTHLWVFSPGQLKAMLRGAGFQVAYAESYHFGCGDRGGGKIPGLPVYFKGLRSSRVWPFSRLGFNLIWMARRSL